MISMKLTGLLQVISIYNMHVLEFLSWWPKVRWISWQSHHKHMGKYGNAFRFAWTDRNRPILTESWPLTPSVMIRVQPTIGGHREVTWDHMRSNEVLIRFSPISRDRIDIETRKWCQTTWLVKPLRKMCKLTYMGHDLTLAWPDIRSKIEIDLSRSKTICFEPARRGKHDGAFSRISLIKKDGNEKPSPWKMAIFHLMTSGTKVNDLRLNLTEKRYRSMRKPPQCFFFSKSSL